MLVLPLAVHADFEKGLKAFEAGKLQVAAEEFLETARNGDHRAMMALGAMYAGGKGVARDYSESLRWYKEAARYGRPDAIYRIGLIYEGGFGVRENGREAARRFLEAAKLGYSQAHFKLATLYRDGGILDRNPQRAYGWFSLAEHGGIDQAVPEIAALKAEMTADELEEAERIARDYARKYATDQ